MRITRSIYFLAITLLLLLPGLAAARSYTYRFENARFDVTFVEIKLQESGEGQLRYKKRDDDEEIELTLKLLPATVQRLQAIFEGLKFLDTQESYQGNAQMAHLGTITIALDDTGRRREVSFNYTDNKMVLKLVELFRAIENQQRRINELRLARQFSPLDLPRQLRFLEDELKRARLAEPTQLLPLLSELALDDSLPLIARNAAEKLAKEIKRAK